MKKIFKYFIAIVTLFTFITKVNAAGATISVNTSASQIIVGNNITVTVTISSSSPLGSWEYNLNYDKNIFSLVSSDVGLHYAGVVQNNSTKAVSYRYTFKANKSGNASFYIDASTVFGFDESIFEVTNGKRNVRAEPESMVCAEFYQRSKPQRLQRGSKGSDASGIRTFPYDESQKLLCVSVCKAGRA